MYSYHDFMVMKGRGSRPRRPAARRTIPTYHAAIKGEDDRLAAPRLQGYAAPRSLTERYGGRDTGAVLWPRSSARRMHRPSRVPGSGSP